MTMPVPTAPKIYHIVHVDRLQSIIADKFLWCDAEISQRHDSGIAIGMNHIKQRRLNLTLRSHPNLHVGSCVPFYFCPRSVMLYVISKGDNPDLTYRDGQDSIVHLESDFYTTIKWAKENQKRWAFTSSNAASYFFEEYCDLNDLGEMDWEAIQTRDWQSCKDAKQAEFLIERQFPWVLISRIGVQSELVYHRVTSACKKSAHKPIIEIKPDWYY